MRIERGSVLPDAPNASEASGEQVLSTQIFERPGSILVVDSDERFRQTAQYSLESCNHEVEFAERIEDALRIAESGTLDLIVVNTVLTDGCGLEFCRALKEDPVLHLLPILVITEAQETALQIKALAYGANDFLTKPVDATIFTARIRNLLKYKRAVEALRKTQRRLAMRVEDQSRDLDQANQRLERRVAQLELTQGRLTQAHHELEQLLQAIPSLLIGLDFRHRVTHWNGRAEQLFGIPAKQMFEIPFRYDLMPWDHEQIRSSVKRCMERHETIRLTEMEIHAQNGESRIFELTLSPIVDPISTHVGVLLIGSDTTERKELEVRYLQSQKMEAIGRLAGGIAHDFNNLLTVIIGQSELGLLPDTQHETMRKRLHEILGCAKRAAGLTDQLLTFSRKQVAQVKLLDLNVLIAETARMLSRMIGEHIKLEIQPGIDLPRIKADPNRIVQVLMNLAVNARDAITEKGRLRIVTQQSALPISVNPDSVTPATTYVVLKVNDNGCGMSAETRSRIFEPFFTTKAPGKGTGLGLATVYGIVKQCGGTIVVESQPGLGTTFSLYFPACDEQEETASGVRSEADRGHETILVVEDEPALREMICEMLQMQGYKPLAPESSHEAIRLSREQPIDLMLTDLVMPEMSGDEVARAVKQHLPSLRVIFMSGYSDSTVAHREILEESRHFLMKPFDRTKLAQKIREVLNDRTPPSG